jgi:hypothetical protein
MRNQGRSESLDIGYSDSEILERLVALNKQPADEESRGQIRYLRPAYQRLFGVPASARGATVQSDLALSTNELTNSRTNELLPLSWPDSLADQIALVRGVISPDRLAARRRRKAPCPPLQRRPRTDPPTPC